MKSVSFFLAAISLVACFGVKAMQSNWPDAIKNFNITRTSWATRDEICITRADLEEQISFLGISNRDFTKGNLLFYAAGFDELLDITDFLLTEGVSPNATTKKGWIPLHHALECNAFKTAYLLAQRGASCKKSLPVLMEQITRTDDPRLFAAQKALFGLLVKKGADINSCDDTQETLLCKLTRIRFSSSGKGAFKCHEIPIEHRLYFVRALLDRNAKIEQRAIDNAQKNGLHEIANLLVAKARCPVR